MGHGLTDEEITTMIVSNGRLRAGPDARHAGPHDTGHPDAGQRDPGQPEDTA
ncbi:MAG TPA: hypothetical protein VIK57_02050 [Streptosporangiaceae bacterium]